MENEVLNRPMIECDNLVKIYKTKDTEVLALQGLELNIAQGELMAIIGNSGSGKSTFLNMVGGLDRPSAGRLIVDGKDLAKLNEKSTVKKVIAVVSGKGGVGKSTVTSMLAVAMARRIRASEQLCAVDKWYSTAGSTPLEPQVGVVTIVLPLAFSSLVARAYAYNFALLLTAALYDMDLFR